MATHPASIETPDARNRDRFSISDLTGEFGLTARALRFYEDKGLIAPQRQEPRASIRGRIARVSFGSSAPSESASASMRSSR